MSETVKFEVMFSESQAAELHAAHAKYGRWMSLAEYRLREQAERLGLTVSPKPDALAE